MLYNIKSVDLKFAASKNEYKIKEWELQIPRVKNKVLPLGTQIRRNAWRETLWLKIRRNDKNGIMQCIDSAETAILRIKKFFKKSIKVSFLHQIQSYSPNRQHITPMILFVYFYKKYHRSITKVS